MEFINKLKTNAFENLTIEDHIVDIHGWIDEGFIKFFSDKLIHRDRLEQLIIFEVGSWKGLSCITMADILKEMGFKNFHIICVDTWLGAPEFWTWGLDDLNRGESLGCINGYPSIFYTFTKNDFHYFIYK